MLGSNILFILFQFLKAIFHIGMQKYLVFCQTKFPAAKFRYCIMHGQANMLVDGHACAAQ
jgi:hypothetical protein